MNTIIGTASDDTLIGTGNADYMRGFTGADVLKGLGGNDVIEGEAGNDTLKGQNGADHLLGGTGNDMLEGGSGKDILDGGYDGFDTAVYYGTEAISVSLNKLGYQNIEGHGRDKIVDIENLIAGSGDDVLRGNALWNSLSGGAGNDHLIGLAGADTLSGGAGRDILDGGSGRDWVMYSAKTGVTVSLSKSGFQKTGDGWDKLVSIENVRGTKAADEIKGNGEDNRLEGRDGNDHLEGKGGDDWLSGGAGADILRAGNGSDVLSGGKGVDQLEGGRGEDTFVFDAFNKSDRDVISDFAPGKDRLVLRDADYTTKIVNGDAVLKFSNGAKLTLQGIEKFYFLDSTVDQSLSPFVIYGLGGILDQGPSEGTSNGVARWEGQTGQTVEQIELVQASTFERLIEQIVRRGFDTVFLADPSTNDGAITDQLAEVAPMYPEVEFGLFLGKVDEPNVTSYPITPGADPTLAELRMLANESVYDFLETAELDLLTG